MSSLFPTSFCTSIQEKEYFVFITPILQEAYELLPLKNTVENTVENLSNKSSLLHIYQI